MTEPFETIKQELEKNPYIVRFQLSRHTVEMMLAEVERLQGELEKFHECETSNGCLDENGYLHTLDNPIPTEYVTNIVVVGRKVYHKEGE